MSEERTTNSRAVFFRLLNMLRPYWGAIALGLLFLLISLPAELFPAMVWRYVVDDIALQKSTSPWLDYWFTFGGNISGQMPLLISAIAWLCIVYLIGELFSTLDTWVLNRVAQRFILDLRNRVYGKLQSQSLSYLQHQRTGDLMSRAMADIDELQSFVVGSIDVIIGESLQWLATVAIVMWIDWRVAGPALAPLVVVYLLLRIFNRRVAPIYKAARDRLGDVSTRLQENLSGVVVIKIFNRERSEAKRFREATENYYDQQIKAINARSLFFPFSRAVGFLSNVLMIGVGGYFMIKEMHLPNGFTPGKLLQFRAYWWRLFGPIQTLARVNDMVQRAIAAANRVFEVLDAPDELPDAPNAIALDKVRGELALNNVTFAYRSDRAAVVLEDVSIKVEPGQTVALAGPSGSGKSTILNLLLRFYDPIDGLVLLDGRDLRSIRRESLRQHFALVQQETFLFNDSILDNIRYGHNEATMEQVIAAAEAANAHEFISRLSDGYNTKVGERGVRLSGGQKQRISIARSEFLANPKILLLDEPTSSVEPESEATIIAALDRLMAGRTTVLTSHRPSLINQADIAYVIEDGRVTASGPPRAVMQQGGWFTRFMQAMELPAGEVID